MWETIIYAVGGTLVGSFGGWFFGRKKQKIEEIDSATDTFNKIIDSLELKIDKLLKQQESDAKKIENMANQIKEMQEQIENLTKDKQENIKLKKKIERYENLLTINNVVH